MVNPTKTHKIWGVENVGKHKTGTAHGGANKTTNLARVSDEGGEVRKAGNQGGRWGRTVILGSGLNFW